jgi:nanoRNase/pAp phosphatase (c-di-AMP/oligoRNAs hydrolase)
MRFIAIAEDELLFEMMGTTVSEEDESVVYLTGDANLRKRIARKGGEALSGDLFSKRIYERAGLDDDCFVVVNVDDPQKLRRAALALREATRSAPIVVLETIPGHLDHEALRGEIPDLEVLALHIPFHDALAKELQHAASRKRVAQYKDDFARADKVLILLHDEPDPDSIGSALALRTILGRDRRTAIIATLGTFTRPENVRMAQLLDIDVVCIAPEDISSFQRIALVDAQPNLFGDKVPEVDLVVDHHPLRRDYRARFQDVRPSYGATATIMTEHLQAAGVTISERLATALLYAIKSDTLFLQRGTSQADVEAFTLHYRQADPAAVRRIEGAGASTGHLKYLAKAMRSMKMEGGLCYAHLGRVEREDFVPWMAEFFIEMDEVEWSAVSGTLQGELVLSLRNLGYQRSAGTLVKETFEKLGNAGGRRAAAKAVIPMKVVKEEAGSRREKDVRAWVWKRLRSAIGL